MPSRSNEVDSGIERNPDPSRLPQWLNMLPLPRPHWTPRYVISRPRLSNYPRRNPDAPWLVSAMNEFLDSYLIPTDTMVEFGPGRSTIWFAARVGRVISVEHNTLWHAKITNDLELRKISNVTYLNPANQADGYVAAAERALGGTKADSILIDGVYRERCAIWALSNVKPGGIIIIIIDNANWCLPHKTFHPPKYGTHPDSDRPEWARFSAATNNWRSSWVSNGVTDTAMSFAPFA